MDKKYSIPFLDLFLSRFWVMPAVLCLACALTYANSFVNGFMMDDHVALFGQVGVENKTFTQIFFQDQAGFYRPVGHFVLWVVFQLMGHHAAGYHAANLLLFTAIVLLFFALFLRITQDRPLAFLAALLYAVHPLNGMIVNYMTASALAAFVLGTQLSVLFFVWFDEHGRKRDLCFSFVFFVFALLSHEMAFAIPAYLAAYILFMGKKGRPGSFLPLVPFLGVMALYFGLRLKEFFFHRIIHGAGLAMADLPGHFTTWFDLAGWYVSKLFIPCKIVFLWSVKYGAVDFPGKAIVFCLILGTAVYGMFFKWKKGWKPFVVAVFLAGLLPSAVAAFSYYPIVWPLLEPHWFYFSQMGFFLLAAALLMKIVRRHQRWGLMICVAVIALLAVLSWQYNARWKTQESYARYWLSLNTGNLTPYYALGRSLFDQGDCQGAVKVFQDGIRELNTNNVYLLADAGHCFDLLHDEANARLFLNAAIQNDPSYAMTYHYIGLYQMRHGDRQGAAAAFQKAVELDPRFSPSKEYLNQ